MIGTILLIIVLVIVAIVGYASTKPNTFTISRKVNIKATPEKISSFIVDFHNWIQWSPYEGRDPAMKKTFSGTLSGKGTVYEFDGNKNVGAGKMEITDTSLSKITLRLEFFRPMKGVNTVDFLLEPQTDSSTDVSWVMYGPMNLMSKVMCMFMSMEKMVGPDFEKGLNSLKMVSEK